MTALSREGSHVTDLNQGDLKHVFQQMNRALRDSQGGGLMERFEAISKLLFTKIVDEREVAGGWNGAPAKAAEELRWDSGDTARRVYERARSVWVRAVSAYPDVFSGSRAEFPPDVAGVARIVGILGSVSLSRMPDDVKGGAYEEILRNTLEKNENQQYFTPRHVVDFMVALTSPTADDAVCDPASGSGGFLIGALNHVQRQGGDLSGFASSLRGAEVDERMAWIARINVLMHGGEPRSVHHLTGAGSLSPLLLVGPSLRRHSYDLILTNPPFGSDMTDHDALRGFETGRGRTSRRRGVLFVERCLELLKPGGRVAIIVDDSVLNLRANGDIRELARRDAVVEAVISLPDVAFMPYSTAKSSILVLRKRAHAEERQGAVFMADVEHVGHRPNGDPLYADEYDELGRREIRSDLPAVLNLHRRFLTGQSVEEAFEGTTVFSVDIDRYHGEPDWSRLDVYYFHPARRAAQDRLDHARFPLQRLEEMVELSSSSVNPAEEYADNSVRWIGLGDIEAQTGRYEVREQPGDRIRSNAHIFRPGDVLFSRLRPKLRKAILIPDSDEGGICSSELLVLRIRPAYADKLLPHFLAYLLRSDLAYGQLIYQITGVGRPRISTEAIRRLITPLPPLALQVDLVQDVSKAEHKADELRVRSSRLAERADREVDEAFERVVGELFLADQVGGNSSGEGAVALFERARAAV